MRTRLILLLVGIVLMAIFAALNWSEFLRTYPLSFGKISHPFNIIAREDFPIFLFKTTDIIQWVNPDLQGIRN